MEFCKDRVFTAVNADELKAGDKVIVADDIFSLRAWAESGSNAVTSYLLRVQDEEHPYRFQIEDGTVHLLAYLVERKENCTNCGNQYKYKVCDYPHHNGKCDRCDFYEPKTEKHYRPFQDTDELIKVWEQKHKGVYPRPKGTMPLIWIKRKGANTKGQLITEFGDGWGVGVGRGEAYNMTELWVHFTFLDGSVCGVEE